MKYLLITFLLFISCDRNENIQSYRIAKNPIEEKTVQLETSSKNNLQWDVPKGWIESSGSKMRLASFNVPYSAGYGDLSVMTLFGDGGGIEANINRWRAQIGLDTQNISDINKAGEKRKNNLGIYQIFKIINAQSKEKAFLCAIMSTNKGTIFIKLSVNFDGINETKDDFIYFCDSFK